MYLYKIDVRRSGIDGKGVFATEPIVEGSIVWKFDPEFDRAMTQEDYANLDPVLQQEIRRVGYVSPTSEKWIYPPVDDPARFTNHSEKNNLKAVFDSNISEEPFFVAKKNINPGEELTVNYDEFDDSLLSVRPDWMEQITGEQR